MNWIGAASNVGTLTNLLEADGTRNAASVTWNSPAMGTDPGAWKNIFPDAPANARMMNGYLDPGGAPATITVSGLPAAITAGGYDVYVYMEGYISFAGATGRICTRSATRRSRSRKPDVAGEFPGLHAGPRRRSRQLRRLPKPAGAAFTLTATPGTGRK
jgi:hypothetical protein